MDVDSIKAQKADIRSRFLAKRKAMSDQEVKDKSLSIISRLVEMNEFRSAKMVHCFVSTPRRHEADTHGLIKDLLSKGVRVAIPVTDLKDKALIHSEIKSLDELEVRTFGILEPKDGYLRPVSLDEIDLVVVPGLAFDPTGNRIGYGAGFYDGFLKSLSVPKMALAYEWQVVPRIAPTPSDVPVDGIVTEERYYDCSAARRGS
jgi:5-formyltetrahydrofolate cyclo-ligase